MRHLIYTGVGRRVLQRIVLWGHVDIAVIVERTTATIGWVTIIPDDGVGCNGFSVDSHAVNVESGVSCRRVEDILLVLQRLRSICIASN